MRHYRFVRENVNDRRIDFATICSGAVIVSSLRNRAKPVVLQWEMRHEASRDGAQKLSPKRQEIEKLRHSRLRLLRASQDGA